MLNTELKPLWEEVESAIAFQANRTKNVQGMVDRYTSPFFWGTERTEEYDPVNHAFEFIGLTQADNDFDGLAWTCETKRGGEYAMFAEAVCSGMNRLTRDIRLADVLGHFYVDQCFSWPIACIQRMPVPGTDQGEQTSVSMRPMVKRISRNRFFQDPLAIERDECRFRGHTSIRDKDDVLAEAEKNPDAGWNPIAIKGLPTGIGLDRLRSEGLRANRRGIDRKEIVIHEVWVAEWSPPAGDPFWELVPEEEWPRYHGGIFTLAEGARQSDSAEKPLAFIREPRPYYGPPSGPYIQGGEFYVPDEITPLSGFVAVEGQVREVNAAEKARVTSDRRRKHLALVSHKNPKLMDAVKNAVDGDVVPANVDNIKQNVIELQLGGSSVEQAETCAVLGDRLRVTSGISDTAAGQPQGDVTATAEAVSDKGAGARAELRKRATTRFVRDIGRALGYFIFYDDEFVMGSDSEGGIVYGGDPSAHEEEILAEMEKAGIPPEIGLVLIQEASKLHKTMSFEDLDLDIEPKSMERVTEAQAQREATILGQLVLEVAQVAPTMPHFNSVAFLNDMGKPWNKPDLGKYLNEEVLQLMGMLAVQQQLQTGMGEAPGPQSGQAQPRPQRDLNTAPAARPALPKRASTPGQPAGAKATAMVK